MNLPVFDNGRIVIVAGVGNKDQDYDDSDVRQLALLMEGMWRLVQRHRLQMELREHRDHLEQVVAEATAALAESEAKYRHLVETTGTGYLILDEAGRVIDANDEYVRHQRASEAQRDSRPERRGVDGRIRPGTQCAGRARVPANERRQPTRVGLHRA